jgi:hypothetical protein
MNAQALSPAMANFKLTSLNAESESIKSSDFYIWLDNAGLPPEVSIRLKELVEKTKEIAGRVISVGRIILMKIIEFVKAHPNFFIGAAIGAAIGSLAHLVPFIGNLLAAITVPLGIFIGAFYGHKMDKREQGIEPSPNDVLMGIPQDIIEIAKDFFKLLAEIFNVIFDKKV